MQNYFLFFLFFFSTLKNLVYMNIKQPKMVVPAIESISDDTIRLMTIIA